MPEGEISTSCTSPANVCLSANFTEWITLAPAGTITGCVESRLPVGNTFGHNPSCAPGAGTNPPGPFDTHCAAACGAANAIAAASGEALAVEHDLAVLRFRHRRRNAAHDELAATAGREALDEAREAELEQVVAGEHEPGVDVRCGALERQRPTGHGLAHLAQGAQVHTTLDEQVGLGRRAAHAGHAPRSPSARTAARSM